MFSEEENRMKIELFDNLVRIKQDDGGFLESSEITDILLAKISQQLECLIVEIQRERASLLR